VRDLDSPRFKVRRRAYRELEKLGESAWSGLRQVLARQPSAEVHRQVDRLLHRLEGLTATPKGWQMLRAVEVLAKIDTRAGRQGLKALATGEPEARMTREARAALARLARGSGPAPSGKTNGTGPRP